MKLLYIALLIVFSIVILQSFSSDTIVILKKLDVSIRRTDSIVHQTKHHVLYLDSAQTYSLNQIDSLNNVIKAISKQVVTKTVIVHDTVFIAYDVD